MQPSGTSSLGGGEGHRDYFSRSLNAPRYACDVLRIKSACVDTSFSTQSEPRSLAADVSLWNRIGTRDTGDADPLTGPVSVSTTRRCGCGPLSPTLYRRYAPSSPRI